MAALVAACGARRLGAGEIPGALIVLETAPGTPGSDPSGAPPRFVLLKDAQVFVGGTSLVEAGRLEKSEAQALAKRAAALRKMPGIGAALAFGGAPERVARLALLDGDPLEIAVTGDPALRARGPRAARDARPRALALPAPEPSAVRAVRVRARACAKRGSPAAVARGASPCRSPRRSRAGEP